MKYSVERLHFYLNLLQYPLCFNLLNNDKSRTFKNPNYRKDLLHWLFAVYHTTDGSGNEAYTDNQGSLKISEREFLQWVQLLSSISEVEVEDFLTKKNFEEERCIELLSEIVETICASKKLQKDPEIMKNTTKIIQTLSTRREQILPSTLDIIPPDILQKVEPIMKNPEVDDIEQSIKDLKFKIHEVEESVNQTRQLIEKQPEQYHKTGNFEEVDEAEFHESLRRFIENIQGFHNFFNEEFSPWMSQPELIVTEIGPLVQKVNRNLSELRNHIKNTQQWEKLMKMEFDNIKDQEEFSQKCVELANRQLPQLRQRIQILEAAIGHASE